MLSKYPSIAVVWLKRDLRLEDHEALTAALENNKLVLLLYVAEDFLLEDPHFSERHLNCLLTVWGSTKKVKDVCIPSD